ncbi:MAG: 6-phosphogluconolactonase [Anaerolineae bacterium]
MTAEIRTYSDAASLAQAAAEHFVTLARKAITSRGQFAVALSGGSTPRATYALLATEEFAARVDWPRVHVFWGDERCVPPDHPDSNYRMAREALLDHVPVLTRNVHRIQGEISPKEAAVDYESTLRSFFAPRAKGKDTRDDEPTPRFDLVLLGMGDDGHTASLFPRTAALHEQTRWVVAHYVENLGAWLVTLTPVAINAAAHITFIVSGASKAERVRQVLSGTYRPDVLPAQIVRPTTGRLLWLVDDAAAALL